MTTPQSQNPPKVAVTSRLIVVVARQGIRLPSFSRGGSFDVELPELLVLEQLATGRLDVAGALRVVVEATGVPTDRFDDLVEFCWRNDLLRASVPTSNGGAVGAVQRPAVGGLRSGPDAPFDSEASVVLATPALMPLDRGRFVSLDFGGDVRQRLSARELHALSRAWKPMTVAEIVSAHAENAQGSALDESAVLDLVGRSVRAGTIRLYDPDDPLGSNEGIQTELMRASIIQRRRVLTAIDTSVAAFDDEDVATDRVIVAPVHTSHRIPPTALGLCFAYAKVHEEGRLLDHYRFHPRWVADHDQVREMAPRVGIFAFSNYLWDAEEHLVLSALVKEVNPGCITIHGGPETPKYPVDVDRYFAEHPHIDVAVHGEGEITFAEALAALAGKSGIGPPDLSVLAEVAGLSYRQTDGLVRTADRERIADLDILPSPYLTGLFDDFVPAGIASIVIETNRGCPYGCTFCDWGSATQSRIRKFDLERVYDELEWAAQHGVISVAVADANFGIFERDLEIAERVASLHGEYNAPAALGTNWAKNRVKFRRPIIETLAAADVLNEGIVSLQTINEETLDAISRSNIKPETYDNLTAEFRNAGLPLAVELMMGLPGSTTSSFKADLQMCVDRDLRARVCPTTLLVNSPMNAPDYRQEHGIVALPGQALEQTTSYARDEYDHMMQLRDMFSVCENFGVLRQVATYARSEAAIREIDLYDRLVCAANDDKDRWPLMSFVFEVTPTLMAPPGSWRPFLDEVARYLVDVEGVADDSALATVFQVQFALLPAFDRSFPFALDLSHDYATWRHAVLDERDAGHRDDWADIVPPLRDFGPAEFVVEDPKHLCATAIGGTPERLTLSGREWEFQSSISRSSPTISLTVA